ncbi:VOC family protein [Amycolatopsis thailandensis]|uniref:VOC family protein n=1 Tax=Amycolatopsis thailandensis TaxID=589330 RepID=UPI00365F01D3
MTEQEKGPAFRQVVLDCTDVRALAEFYRRLLVWNYRPGDEPPRPGAEDKDWLVLRNPDGGAQIAFQQVDRLEEASWPDPAPVPQQLHLDLTVDSVEELDVQHRRVLELGGRLRSDRSDDPEEPLRVYADPAGHPFCVFVA